MWGHQCIKKCNCENLQSMQTQYCISLLLGPMRSIFTDVKITTTKMAADGYLFYDFTHGAAEPAVCQLEHYYFTVLICTFNIVCIPMDACMNRLMDRVVTSRVEK